MTVHFLYQLGLAISDLLKSQAHIVEPNVKLNCKGVCSHEQSFDTKFQFLRLKYQFLTLYSKWF